MSKVLRLHKDFYLAHPDPSLQTPKFCYGNLQEAHPRLRERTEEEAVEWRTEVGITAEVVWGRPLPKPITLFVETSFPEFVEHAMFELFADQAGTPSPLQAQAWPCVLSGMDVVAMAPKASGKTLVYLLPSMVHVIAQRRLQPGAGPIALVLVPTIEVAEQVYGVANKYYNGMTDVRNSVTIFTAIGLSSSLGQTCTF